ncbi:MAG TPA: metallopeptidase TldD-related protein, partial [Candidatus Dormibacteraeota bacterium]|nr:metallopeptidase TldD-related protein [Candidatus Dormibacteraeota bacterium]
MSSGPTRDDLLAIAGSVLDAVPHGEAEVVVTETDSALTRFAHNAVHQNVAESWLSIRLRLQHEGRVGVGTVRGGAADIPATVARLVASTEGSRRLAPVSEGLLPVVAGVDGSAALDAAAAWSDATAGCEPEERADRVAVVAGAAARAGVEAYGAMQTSATQRAIATTAGLSRCARTTMATLRATVRGGDGGGYADRNAVDVSDIAADEMADEVVATTLRNQGAEPLAPGTYEVVLTPYAAAELTAWFAQLVFNALSVEEHRSCYAEGRRLASEAFSLVDDPTEAAAAGFPFDGEGVTGQPVTLLDRGVAAGLLHDRVTARSARVESNGHSLQQPNTRGPFAGHLVVAPGDAAVDELVAGVGRGLLLTRLWYIRAVHELHT